MSCGLILGKFAPFHRGHCLLIDRAVHETDHVVIVIYDAPETTSIPLPVRADWIRREYSTVEVLEAWDGPTIIGDTPEIRNLHETYLLKFLEGRIITHVYSSEFYGDHISRALGAVDCRVDEARITVPVSGSMIRQDPHAHREHLPAHVHGDCVTRVVFLGAMSTGKTTICTELASRFGTVWMPEYGRDYWLEHHANRRLTPEQLVEIAEGHCAREDALIPGADRFLFVDTDATTTYMFSLYYHGFAHPRLVELADQCRTRYDLFFLCSDDIPYDDTWDRSGAAQRVTFQKQIRADLLRRKTPFITLRGCHEERINTVLRVLNTFDRFRSLADHLLQLREEGAS